MVTVGRGAKAISTTLWDLPYSALWPSVLQCSGSRITPKVLYFEKTGFPWLCPHPRLSISAAVLMLSSPRPQDMPTVLAPLAAPSLQPPPASGRGCQHGAPFCRGEEGRRAGAHDQMVFLPWRSIRT